MGFFRTTISPEPTVSDRNERDFSGKRIRFGWTLSLTGDQWLFTLILGQPPSAGFKSPQARQQRGGTDEPISMASLKRWAFNQHLLDRICDHLAHGQSLEKSSPDYETLSHYGIITKEAA